MSVRRLAADLRRKTGTYFNKFLALRKIFWKAGVMARNEHVGGSFARTVTLEIANGQITLRHAQTEQVFLSSGSKTKGADRGI
jgi:hypothetical protein